ncbi:PAS domain S-box protein [Brevundimonas vitis]|uniref:histidine kinase n=1 Tax=Brevundimonas vitisensis TaxID=2800818 RepID=A0ABX7BPP2_9CAUL|nr:PAS domain S-box protein [Brevundimonas vitisensis]QQQ19557.1 PAS domain S-box protein [Brevundimonas vitisensis]
MTTRPAKAGEAAESALDRLVHLACTALGTPMGLVSILGEQTTAFCAVVGTDLQELPTEVSVTRALVEMGSDAVLVIGDALNDPRFCRHPMVTGPEAIRFYAGATVRRRDGVAVGAIGVMDRVPRDGLTPDQMVTLKRLAALSGDLVDQMMVEQTQAEQLQMLQLAESMAGVGHWRWDVTTNRVNWSDEVYRIHALDRASFDPSLDSAVGAYHPEDQVRLNALIEHSLATGEGYDFELRIIRADGAERITRAKAVCETDGTGRVRAMFGVFQDVTEDVQAQAAVTASEARYRLLADNATDIIATYSLDGRFGYVSPSVEVATGYRPEELIGRPVTDFLYPDDVPSVLNAFQTLSRAGSEVVSARIAYRARRKNGSLVWLEAHPRLLRDADGQPIEFHDVTRDITHTKALEEQLTLARDKAEAGARVKSEFLANMSHELRTPLTSVIGFSGLLQSSKALPQAERLYADRIATSSEALLSVINDILDYSKLEADAVELDPQPFDPRELAESAASIVEDQCAKKGLALVVAVADDLPETLMGDANRLRQVLLNFLSNAVKFTAKGQITLTVGGAATSEGWRLKAQVRDSGIGIAADKIDALFERFAQADASTTRNYGGTGLGLSISRRLIEMMGGEIGAESQAGEGSTFWFEASLPLAHAEWTDLAEIEPVAMPTGARLLMADDTAANRELVTVMLGGFGLTVDTASDGAEAVEAVRSRDYDLVLMDVHMPVMDGLAATRAIRALGGAAARVPIIALTANVQAENVRSCLEAGMDDHVAKPIQVADLVAAIGRQLSPASDMEFGVRHGV